MELLRLDLQMNLVNNKEISSLIDIMTKVRNHKTCNFVQHKPERLWPLLYELNRTNKKNINLPRY